MKMRKPNPEIFEYVLKEYKLDPAETLFIDDSLQHLKTAASLECKPTFLQQMKVWRAIYTDQACYKLIENCLN